MLLILLQMPIKREELVKQIKESNLPAAVLCYGEETFFHEDILNNLRKSYGGEGGWGYEVVDATNLDPAKLVASAGTLSFGGGTKLTVIRSAHRLNKTQLDGLSKIAGRACQERSLVLLAEKNLKTTDKLLLWAKEYKVKVCKFTAPKPSEMGTWLRAQARARGFSIDDETQTYMIDIASENLMALTQMLDKIDLFREERKHIKRREVEDLLHDTFEKKVYDCVSAVFNIGMRNVSPQAREKGAEELRRVLRFSKKDGILQVVRALAREAFTLLKYHDLLTRRVSSDQMATELKLGPRKWLLKSEYPLRAEKWPSHRLKRLLTRLAEVDLAVRSTGRDPEAMLEQIVIGNLAPTSVEEHDEISL